MADPKDKWLKETLGVGEKSLALKKNLHRALTDKDGSKLGKGPQVSALKPLSRPQKSSQRLQTFPVDEIVVNKPAPGKRPEVDPSITADSKNYFGAGSEDGSEAAEKVSTGLHIAGGLIEGAGEEALSISLAGLVLEIAGVYIHYLHTICQAYTQRTEGGALEGAIWVLLGAFDLDSKGGLGTAGKDDFVRNALWQMRLDLDSRHGASRTLEKEGGQLGSLARTQGREEGIKKESERLESVMKTAESRYEGLRAELIIGKRPTNPLLRSGLTSRQKAYENAGIHFKDPKKDIQLMKHLVLQKILEQLGQLQAKREKIAD